MTKDAEMVRSRSVSGAGRSRVRIAVRSVGLYALVIPLGVFFVFPFLYTVMSSLKAPWEIYNYPPTLIPEQLLWSNYPQAVTMYPFGTWLFNTLTIVMLSTAGTLLSASCTAFGFARFKFRFRDGLFLITLSTMMLPAQVTMIPQFIMFFRLGQWTSIPFLNTLRPLWIPAWFGGGAFAIFLLRQFIQTIPVDLDEAALIDGAGYPRIYKDIVMPLCKPALATLAIIRVIGQWNSFVEPLIYINDPKKFPISVGLKYFEEDVGGWWATGEPKQQLLMAASVLSIIVPITLFFAFQRYFVQGVVMSGIKG